MSNDSSHEMVSKPSTSEDQLKEESSKVNTQSISDITKPLSQITINSEYANDETKNELQLEMKLNELFRTLEPFVLKLDEHVIAVRTSQELLNQELAGLMEILHQIKVQESLANISKVSNPDQSDILGVSHLKTRQVCCDISSDIEEKSRRLLGLKRRLTLVHSILQTVNSRTKKLLLAHNSRISTISSITNNPRS